MKKTKGIPIENAGQFAAQHLTGGQNQCCQVFHSDQGMGAALVLSADRYASFIMIKKYFFLLLFFFLINKLFCQSYELFLDSNIRIICTIEKFVPSEHTIDICDTGLGWKGICLIDNEPLYGTDLEMPMNYFRNMSLIINNIDIPLDTKYMYNVELQGRFSKDQFKLFKEEMGYYLYGLFSDAAGCYGACWQIINNKSFRTVITQDEWFWNMFEDLE